MVAIAEQRQTTGVAVERGQEIVVRTKNDVGILFHISTLLSKIDVNILGVSAGVCGEDCLIRLITDDNAKTKEVLTASNFVVEQENVIQVELPHKPGTLKQVTKLLAEEGIDIRHVYAAASKGQAKCLLVFHSSDDDIALTKLDAMSEGTDASAEGQNAHMVSEGGPIY